MKQDLDHLMETRNLDAILVNGKTLGNPPLIYLLNGAKLTQGLIIKKQGEKPTLIANPMEREEAVASGYRVILSSHYKYGELLKQLGDPLAANVAYYKRIFADLGISGNVGCYGYDDQGSAYALLSALNEATSTIKIIGEYGTNIIEAARATKDAAEVDHIRDMGQRTAEVVRQTVLFLQAQHVNADETLRQDDGTQLTVGDVHAHIRRLIALQDLEDPEGFVFATGRDAGIPHSRGSLEAPIRLGESIVFDIFPRGAGGGYFFDMTRTFCLGYAPEAVQKLHNDVLTCLNKVKAALQVGEYSRTYQKMTCQFFKERGHPTIASDPSTLNGYVHSLGHGLGIYVHEVPFFHDSPSNLATLSAGHVFALEPGLYYPEKGMGCRVEDVMWIDENQRVHTLTDFHYDLVIPMS